jgi:hypothetical protein
LVPPISIYYGAESLWHSDGRKEVCGKIAACKSTLTALGGAPTDYGDCMRLLDIKLAGETRARQLSFERYARSVEKMTCNDLAASFRQGERELQEANR